MKQSKFLIASFGLILALPLLDNIFHFSPVEVLFEKRSPVSLPPLPKTFLEAEKFSKKFENFFNDNYGFRKTLIKSNSRLMDEVFGESVNVRTLIGKDDWLFFENHKSLLDAVGKAEISDKLIASGVRAFGKNWQKMRSQNIDYLLVIAPDKETIYSEFLPDYIDPKGPHRLDKFLAALRKKYPDFPVLDLRPTLLEAKKNEILYHKTDTHWNMRGAHYGYLAIMKELKIAPHLRNEFTNKEDEMFLGDISMIGGIEAKNLNYDLVANFKKTAAPAGVLEVERKKFKEFESFAAEDKNLPVLFVERDSFFNNLQPLVNEHFSQSFYIKGLACGVNDEIVARRRPNVVIQEFIERNIENILTKCETDEKK
jgi:alginate O-acetyltransferase complex protein AlgJ